MQRFRDMIYCKRKIVMLLLAELIAIVLYGLAATASFSGQKLIFSESDMQVQNKDNDVVEGNYLDVSFQDAKAVVTPAFQLTRGIYYIEAVYARQGIVKAGLLYDIPRNGKELVDQDEIELNPDKDRISYRVKIHDDSKIRFKLRLTGDAVEGDYIQLLQVNIVSSKLTFVYRIFWLAAVMILADLLVFGYVRYYRKWDVERRMVFVVLSLTAFFLGLPLYRSGLSTGSDLTFHLSRLEGLYRSLDLAGGGENQFPVRIQSGWLDGYGYAASIFYGDIFLYFPALLRMVGFTLEEAYKAYLVMVNTATVFIAFYAFRRITREDIAAMAGSILYAGCAQRVALTYTAVLGGASGMVFYPLIAAGFYLLFTEDVESKEYKKIWILLTTGFTGILMTHMLSCLIVGAYTVLLCIVMLKKVLRRNTMRELMKAAGVAVLWNLWFLVPLVQYMFTEKLRINSRIASVSKIEDYYATLEDFTQEGRNLYQLFTDRNTLGFAMILVLMLYLVTIPVQKKDRRTKHSRVVAGFMLFTVIVCTDLFPVVELARRSMLLTKFFRTIQYQYRLMSVAMVLVACLAAIFFTMEVFDRKNLYYIVGILCCVTLYQNFQYYTTLSCDAVYLDGISLESRTDNGIYSYKVGNGEYLPVMTETRNFVQEIEGEEPLVVSEIERNNLSFDIRVENPSSTEKEILFPVLYYGGYQAKDPDSHVQFRTAVGDNGRVSVMIPQGYAGALHLGFYEPLLWRIAEGISVLTLAGIVTWVCQPGIMKKMGKRRRQIMS